MRCIVCDLEGAKERVIASGKRYGPCCDGCSGECLVATFADELRLSPTERRRSVWIWRRRRALAHGIPFHEVPP